MQLAGKWNLMKEENILNENVTQTHFSDHHNCRLKSIHNSTTIEK